MNFTKTLIAKIAFLSVLLAFNASAANYTLDTVHTQIMFSVSHHGFSDSRGAFTDFDGQFSFDEGDFSSSAVEVTIQTASLDLNDSTWNEHLSGEKWFDVEQFPTISFKSTSVEKTGDQAMKVVGDLTIKGVTKPAVMEVEVNKVGSMMGKEKAGFSATMKIDRTEWGMSTFAPAIGAEVKIRVEVEGFKQAG